MPKPSKYTLCSAEKSKNGKALCAFFASDEGCKNGDKCKFLHELPSDNNKKSKGTPQKNQKVALIKDEDWDTDSVKSAVSSESSSSEEERQAPVQSKKLPKQKTVTTPAKRKNESKDEFTHASLYKTESTATADVEMKSSSKKEKKSKKTLEAAPQSEERPTKKLKSKSPDIREKEKSSEKRPKSESSAKKPDFRSLNLPIAKFVMPVDRTSKTPEKYIKKEDSEETKSSSSESEPEPSKPKDEAEAMPFLLSNEKGRKWLDAVMASTKHHRYSTDFDMDEKKRKYLQHPWVKTKKYGDWCKDFPQVIAIDCEMCETKDPLSGEKDHAALCRISVVDAETREALIDTLVKPAWPITDARTRINGITEEDLKPVEFTLRHAQAFLMALCSEQTVIVGHSLTNDLVALRLEHYCIADTSYLFRAEDSDRYTVSLKDLAKSVLNKEMPNVHDSVNDALTAFDCAAYWVENKGNVAPIERTRKLDNETFGSQLLVHRIPRGINEKQISSMFRKYTFVEPSTVDKIEGGKDLGKTFVHFASSKHADLAFESLKGETTFDVSRRPQKIMYLKGRKSHIKIRKMRRTFQQHSHHRVEVEKEGDPFASGSE